MGITKIAKRKLSTEVIADQLAHGDVDLMVAKSIARSDVVIEGESCTELTIVDCRFKHCLAIQNCAKLRSLTIKGSNISTNLTIRGCPNLETLRIYDTDVGRTVTLVESRVERSTTFDSLDAEHLEIFDVKTGDLQICTSSKQSRLARLHLTRCRIAGSARCSNVVGLVEVDITQTVCNDFALATIDAGEVSTFSFQASKCSTLKIVGCNFGAKVSMSFRDVIADSLRVSGNTMNITNIVFADTNLHHQLVLNDSYNIECFVDISGVTVPASALDDSLLVGIRWSKLGGPLYGSRATTQHALRTTNFLRTKMANEGRHDVEDICYYNYKSVESDAVRQAGRVRAYWLRRILMQGALGWGVRIANPIYASILVTVTFAAFFFVAMGLYKRCALVTFMDVPFSGPLAAIIASLSTLLGHFSEVEADLTQLMVIAMLGEFLIGLILITVLVGIVIRKMVR